jgi:hypothetical protein
MKKKTSKKMGRPKTNAVYESFSIRLQVSPIDEATAVKRVAAASGMSKAAYVQREVVKNANAALKDGVVTHRIPKG